MLWRNFLCPEFGAKFQREVPLFLKLPEFLYNTVWDRWKEAPVPKTIPIRSTASIEHRIVIDRQTDTDTMPIASTRANIASRW